MTREEAARILDPETSRDELWKYEADTRIEACNEACRMGADALRAQQERENTKAMTMDELREMDGEPVWVVYDEDAGMWALVEVCEESIFLTNNLGGRTEYASDVELEDDGITVYRQKPKEGTI